MFNSCVAVFEKAEYEGQLQNVQPRKLGWAHLHHRPRGGHQGNRLLLYLTTCLLCALGANPFVDLVRRHCCVLLPLLKDVDLPNLFALIAKASVLIRNY
jgi:hypothetical protein